MAHLAESRLTYWLALGGATAVALVLAWLPLGGRIDNYALDWMMNLHPPEPWQPQSAILAVDDASIRGTDGLRMLRPALAKAFASMANREPKEQPKAVAIDFLLTDRGLGTEDAILAEALGRLPRVVLAATMTSTNPAEWELPLPAFRSRAGVGHAHADPDPRDGISRILPLEKRAQRQRYWALALEAFRLMQQHKIAQEGKFAANGEFTGPPIVETPSQLEVGQAVVPSSMAEERPLRIRYLPPDEQGNSRIPHVTLAELLAEPQRAKALAGKVVFVGVTSQTALRDRLMTPYKTSLPMPGVEIHAHAFETMARGTFYRELPLSISFLLGLAYVVFAGLLFLRLSGPPAYAGAAALLLLAHSLPHLLFRQGDIILPYLLPILSAWAGVITAGAFAFLRTRGRLAQAEMEKDRYQQAIHFVTHELRTPLTAIQGSSELMGRYKLTEEKQKQLAQQINNESKRLAKMITTFLNVEKLNAGQLDWKSERFPLGQVVETCLGRARQLADNKQIQLDWSQQAVAGVEVQGDREMFEYAVYNLLTNAIKYSPAGTQVQISTALAKAMADAPVARLSVQDQGQGISKEDQKHLFEKFYRTKSAEQSGVVGTGLGLSLVKQIVEHHQGQVRVESSLGVGSCFTIEVPAVVTSASGPVPSSESISLES